MTAERRSDKERQHHSQLNIVLYGCSLLTEISKARRLYTTLALGPIPLGGTEYEWCERPLFHFDNTLLIFSPFFSFMMPVTSRQLGPSKGRYIGVENLHMKVGVLLLWNQKTPVP